MSLMALEHKKGTREGEGQAEVSGPEYIVLLEEVKKCFPEKEVYKLRVEVGKYVSRNMKRGGTSGRENSTCNRMLAGDNMRCSRNVSIVLLEHEVGQRRKKEK